MNSSNAKQFLPLVQALAEGKTIQIKHTYKGGVWEDEFNVEFSLGPENYRVKPEPQVLYMVRHKTGRHNAVITDNLELAKNALSRCHEDLWELVTFTENL